MSRFRVKVFTVPPLKVMVGAVEYPEPGAVTVTVATVILGLLPVVVNVAVAPEPPPPEIVALVGAAE